MKSICISIIGCSLFILALIILTKGFSQRISLNVSFSDLSEILSRKKIIALLVIILSGLIFFMSGFLIGLDMNAMNNIR